MPHSPASAQILVEARALVVKSRQLLKALDNVANLAEERPQKKAKKTPKPTKKRKASGQ